MIGLLKFAFNNVWRSRVRSVSLLVIISIGVAVLLLIAAVYQFMFFHVAKTSVAEKGDILLIATQDNEKPLMWDEYIAIKAALQNQPGIRDIGAEVAVSGLLGNGDLSAASSGIAVEAIGDQPVTESADQVVPVKLGIALARTLHLKTGDSFGGLIADSGMTLRVCDVVKTEVQVKDRFYMQIPITALLTRDLTPSVNTIHVWLKTHVSAPGLGNASSSPDYAAAVQAIRAIPQLKNFALFSMPEGNTNVNQIVEVYRSNYVVVVVVVALTLILAFFNVLSLSVHERQQELGTLRSMGTPLWQIRFLVVAETLWIALLSWGIGLVIAVVADQIINTHGGIVLAPPPGSDTEIRVGTILSGLGMLQAGALVVAGALLSAILSASRLGKSSVVAQLAVRD